MSTTSLMALVKAKKAALEAQSGRRTRTVKPQPGKSRWRILPSWRKDDSHGEKEQFFHDFGQHFIKDSRGEIKAVYICTERTFNKPCAVCETLSNAVDLAEDDETLKIIEEARSKTKILVNALHLNGEDPSAPVILELTPSIFEKITVLMIEHGDSFIDLKTGSDIVIERSGKGLNTKYDVIAAAKSAPVDKSVMARLHDLDEYVQQEYEQGQTKALAAVAEVTGAGARLIEGKIPGGVLTGSSRKMIEAKAEVIEEEDLEEELVEEVKSEPTPAKSKEEKPASKPADDFDKPMDDEDIERLLRDMA